MEFFEISKIALFGAAASAVFFTVVKVFGIFKTASKFKDIKKAKESLEESNKALSESIDNKLKIGEKYDKIEGSILNAPSSIDTSKLLNSYDYMPEDKSTKKI